MNFSLLVYYGSVFGYAPLRLRREYPFSQDRLIFQCPRLCPRLCPQEVHDGRGNGVPFLGTDDKVRAVPPPLAGACSGGTARASRGVIRIAVRPPGLLPPWIIAPSRRGRISAFPDAVLPGHPSPLMLVARLDSVLVLKQVYAVVHALHGERDFSQELGRL